MTSGGKTSGCCYTDGYCIVRIRMHRWLARIRLEITVLTEVVVYLPGAAWHAVDDARPDCALTNLNATRRILRIRLVTSAARAIGNIVGKVVRYKIAIHFVSGTIVRVVGVIAATAAVALTRQTRYLS